MRFTRAVMRCWKLPPRCPFAAIAAVAPPTTNARPSASDTFFHVFIACLHRGLSDWLRVTSEGLTWGSLRGRFERVSVCFRRERRLCAGELAVDVAHEQLFHVAPELGELDADAGRVPAAGRHDARDARDRFDHQLASHFEVHSDEVQEMAYFKYPFARSADSIRDRVSPTWSRA